MSWQVAIIHDNSEETTETFESTVANYADLVTVNHGFFTVMLDDAGTSVSVRQSEIYGFSVKPV